MKKLLAIVAMCLSLTACGEMVEVPPAYYGKVLTKDGFQPGVVPPSKFRLPMCWAYCDKLVVAEASDNGMRESFTLFMPKNELTMSFDVRMTVAIKSDERTLNGVFDRLPYTAKDGWNVVSADRIYHTYGKPVVRSKIRSLLVNYSIEEVASSRDKINAELAETLSSALKDTPLVLKTIDLADAKFPDIITNAKEQAAQRREQIAQQEAQREITKVKLEAELEQAKMNKAIRLERADAVLKENEIVAKSVTPEYLEYRRLEVLEAMANNKNTVFVPVEALGSVGLSNRVLNK